MLAQSVMIVVFVRREKITYGRFLSNGVLSNLSLGYGYGHKVP